MSQKDWQKDPLIPEILAGLKGKFGCHTFILYGSRARGDAHERSDYDIAAFRDDVEPVREGRVIQGVYLDAWIYPASKAVNPDESLLQIRDGIVLEEREGLGTLALQKISAIHDAGPEPLAEWDREFRRVWIRKMIDRMAVGDIEGNFRRHWLLFELLENYFRFQSRWYSGPKVALRWLQENEPVVFDAFDCALRPSASDEDVLRHCKKVLEEA
ncbi:nucleotidyltransferase domain-containing protein [bacterium]|jgi:predicted nucleotidyltransferase|nr:nucleotidyltransferase domain-containing protein [bacterium]